MNPAGKIVCLLILFAFIFILPLSSEPLPGGDNLTEEEPIVVEETPVDEEIIIDEESLPGEEPDIGGELFVDEEPIPDEEPYIVDEIIPDQEFLPDDEFFPDDELNPGDGSPIYDAPPLIFEAPRFIFEMRSFDTIFPGFSRSQKAEVMNGVGLRHSFERDDFPMLTPDPASGIDLLSRVMEKDPSHLIEALVVAPYNERELDMLDIYNALGRIENIKDHTVSVNGRDFNVFVESTRLESSRNRKSIPDPPPANELPYSETMYLRLKEMYFGNIFVRGEVSMGLYGITYSMTNFTDVRYLLFRVMKAERFSAIIYLEPVKEGVLIYCVSGLYLPGFIADRVNLTPSINYRISVLLNWITDGLQKQGNIIQVQ